jgi:hypothetical protein
VNERDIYIFNFSHDIFNDKRKFSVAIEASNFSMPCSVVVVRFWFQLVISTQWLSFISVQRFRTNSIPKRSSYFTQNPVLVITSIDTFLSFKNIFVFKLFVIVVQQMEKFFWLSRSKIRSSHCMMAVRANDIRWGKMREEKIRDIIVLIMFCSTPNRSKCVCLLQSGYTSVVNYSFMFGSKENKSMNSLLIWNVSSDD